MNNILLITSSPRGTESLSTRLATELAHGLLQKHDGAALTVRNLSAQPLAHIDENYIQGRFLPVAGRTAAQTDAVTRAEMLISELQVADLVIIGSGMINFGPSSQLKAWFDHIIWPGVTVKYTEAGAQGLVTGKKVYLVTASGGTFSEGALEALDFQTHYLKHLLGFIGLTDVELMRLEGTAYGPDAAKAAIAKTEAAVRATIAEAA